MRRSHTEFSRLESQIIYVRRARQKQGRVALIQILNLDSRRAQTRPHERKFYTILRAGLKI